MIYIKLHQTIIDKIKFVGSIVYCFLFCLYPIVKWWYEGNQVGFTCWQAVNASLGVIGLCFYFLSMSKWLNRITHVDTDSLYKIFADCVWFIMVVSAYIMYLPDQMNFIGYVSLTGQHAIYGLTVFIHGTFVIEAKQKDKYIEKISIYDIKAIQEEIAIQEQQIEINTEVLKANQYYERGLDLK